jgi:hypothetical protein
VLDGTLTPVEHNLLSANPWSSSVIVLWEIGDPLHSDARDVPGDSLARGVKAGEDHDRIQSR